jgi:hypothetical protein
MIIVLGVSIMPVTSSGTLHDVENKVFLQLAIGLDSARNSVRAFEFVTATQSPRRRFSIEVGARQDTPRSVFSPFLREMAMSSAVSGCWRFIID